MVIWTGLGFLVAIIGFGALVGTEFVVESITGNESYYQENPWTIFLGMLVAAAVTFVANQTILSSSSKSVVDKETGEEMELRKNHSLFFIPTKWWPAIFIAIGALFTFSKYTGS